MYEQLLSAPHGSVRKYKSLKDGEAQVEENMMIKRSIYMILIRESCKT